MALKVCLTSLEYKDAAVLHELYKTNTHTHNRLTAVLQTTRVGRYQKKHSPIHIHPDVRHPLSNSSIYYDP